MQKKSSLASSLVLKQIYRGILAGCCFVLLPTSNTLAWEVKVKASASGTTGGSISGNGSSGEPWVVCQGDSAIITFEGYTEGTTPSSTTGCDITGPNWTFSGDVSSNSATATKTEVFSGNGSKSYSGNATAKFTAAPKACPDCPSDSELSKSGSKQVFFSVVPFTSGAWTTVRKVDVDAQYPAIPQDSPYDRFEDIPIKGPYGEYLPGMWTRVHEVGKITFAKHTIFGPWVCLHVCGASIDLKGELGLEGGSYGISVAGSATISKTISPPIPDRTMIQAQYVIPTILPTDRRDIWTSQLIVIGQQPTNNPDTPATNVDGWAIPLSRIDYNVEAVCCGGNNNPTN